MTPGSDLYPAVDASLKRFAASSGKEPGDPRKQSRRIIEVVMRDGELPSRFALGVSMSFRVPIGRRAKHISRHSNKRSK